jgi:hypothetical protein
MITDKGIGHAGRKAVNPDRLKGETLKLPNRSDIIHKTSPAMLSMTCQWYQSTQHPFLQKRHADKLTCYSIAKSNRQQRSSPQRYQRKKDIGSIYYTRLNGQCI